MPSQSEWAKREEALRQQFEELQPDLEVWGETVDGTITTLLNEAGFDPHGLQMPPSHRVKTADSFIGKALYRPKSKNYADPLTDIKDKVATRLVVLTKNQVEEVGNILLNHGGWKVEVDRIISNGTELGPTAFGYQSLHLIVSHCENKEDSSDILLKKLVCEVQVRTLLQHAYAEVSHDTAYKGSYQYEPTIQRKLARSMALMEVVDESFQAMFDSVRSNELASSAFSREMNARFADLWPGFKQQDVDTELFSYLFDTLYATDVVDASKLDAFVVQYKSALKRTIERNKSHLARQPIILFVAYLLKNRPHMLHERWELDYAILRDLGREMGISVEQFA